MELRDLLPLLLRPDQMPPAEELLREYDCRDIPALYENYRELFEEEDTVESLAADIADGTIDAGVLLTWYMELQGILLQLDWDGEDERGLLQAFVNYHLEDMGADFTVDTDPVYERFDEAERQGGQQLHRGGHLPVLFHYVERQLIPQGFCLLNFCIFSQQYYIGVFLIPTSNLLKAANTTDVLIVPVP